MFYEFDQNNSGGSFVVNDEVCHRLFIEADSEEQAISKAEELGCYWNGVADGIDCPCCGDRWSRYAEKIDLVKYAAEGYEVSIYDGIYSDTVAKWNSRYGKFQVIKPPKFKKVFSSRVYVGSICFADIAEYAQYLADEYGWTTPDARVYYKDGRVSEIHSSKKKKE